MSQETSIYSASAQLSDDEIRGCSKLLAGFLDLHIHLAPDTVKRACDDLEFASDASKIGYRGFLLKDHFAPTTGRAYDLRKLFPALGIFGGITLNHEVGGLNPDAVEAAIKAGAKEIWMPTFGASNHYDHFKAFGLPGLVSTREVKRKTTTKNGLTILDGSRVRPEVLEILGMIADANIILGTGHLSLPEVHSLVDSARKARVKKILVTHPEFSATKWPVEDQLKLAEKGAILEHCANIDYDAKLYAKNIKRVGFQKCVLSSDSGQVKKGHPALVMKKFLEDVMAEGVSESEIHTMAKVNPATLLEIEA
jgi:hypothetical protein